MRKNIWLILAFLPFMSGCSWITQFVVANKSASTVYVEYEVAGEGTKAPGCPDNYFFPKPKVTKIEQVGDAKWNDLPDAVYNCDSNTRKVKIELQPGNAVFTFKISGYSGFVSEEKLKEYKYFEYPIKSLSITSKQGKLQYEGTQVTKGFEKKNIALYILNFE